MLKNSYLVFVKVNISLCIFMLRFIIIMNALRAIVTLIRKKFGYSTLKASYLHSSKFQLLGTSD